MKRVWCVLLRRSSVLWTHLHQSSFASTRVNELQCWCWWCFHWLLFSNHVAPGAYFVEILAIAFSHAVWCLQTLTRTYTRVFLILIWVMYISGLGIFTANFMMKDISLLKHLTLDQLWFDQKLYRNFGSSIYPSMSPLMTSLICKFVLKYKFPDKFPFAKNTIVHIGHLKVELEVILKSLIFPARSHSVSIQKAK